MNILGCALYSGALEWEGHPEAEDYLDDALQDHRSGALSVVVDYIWMTHHTRFSKRFLACMVRSATNSKCNILQSRMHHKTRGEWHRKKSLDLWWLAPKGCNWMIYEVPLENRDKTLTYLFADYKRSHHLGYDYFFASFKPP